jgi:iron complex outermembrane receptor protein
LLAGPAIAQDEAIRPAPVDAAKAVSRLDEVTVTARRIEENLQSVPVAVTAYSGEELKEKGVVSVGDIASFTPGFTTREANSQATALIFSIRGQLQNDVLATLDPSVGTYVDDVYWARAYGLNFNLLDMERVQVLKGPQGTLFGRNTTGGALVFTTANPSLDQASGRFTATAGSYSEQTFEGVVNVPLSDRVAVRGAVRSSDRDGYIDDIVTGEEYNDRDTLTGRLKVLFTPSDDVEIVLSAEFYDQSMNGAGTGTIFSAGLTGAYLSGFDPILGVPMPVAVPNYVDTVRNSDGDRIALDGDPFIDIEAQTFTGILSWDMGSGTLKAIAGTRSVESQNRLDLDGFAAGSGAPLHTTSAGQDLEQTSFEVQYAGNSDNQRLHYVMGATWFEESGYDETLTDLRVVPDPVILRFLGDIDNTSIGVYGQGTYDLNDKLALTLGLRYSEDEKGITTINGTSAGATNTFLTCDSGQAPPCNETYSDTYDELSYTIGADYDVSNDVMVYGKFSHGYRSGGQNLRLSGTADLDFDPETNDEFEIGMKGDFLDKTLRLNLAAYSNTISDAQRSIIVPLGAGNATVVQNAAELTTTGFELEALWAPTDNLTFQAAASVLDAEYDEYVDAGVDVSDRRIIGVPEAEFSLAMTYERDMGFAEMAARIDYAWRDDYFNNELAPSGASSTPELQDAITSPSSDTVNVRLGLDFKNGWDVAFWGRNITDDRSKTGALYLSNFGYVNGIFREPATYGLTLTRSFGGE